MSPHDADQFRTDLSLAVPSQSLVAFSMSTTNLFGSATMKTGILALMGTIFLSTSAMAEGAKFNSKNELIRPEGFRYWVFLGAPITPNDLNNGKANFPEFHDVYIRKDDFEHFEKTGKFRDGTMIVKELVSVGSKSAPSGNGYFMGGFNSLEVTVKDEKRFAKEPGGWAYFSFGEYKDGLKKSVAAQPTEKCAACHQATAQNDLVFGQYYPVLNTLSSYQKFKKADK